MCPETVVGHKLYDPSFLMPRPFGPGLNKEVYTSMFQHTYDAVMNERRTQYAEVNVGADLWVAIA